MIIIGNEHEIIEVLSQINLCIIFIYYDFTFLVFTSAIE